MKLNKVFLIILTLSSSLLFSEPNEDFVFSASQNNLAGNETSTCRRGRYQCDR
jgi:hypothetical protein